MYLNIIVFIFSPLGTFQKMNEVIYFQIFFLEVEFVFISLLFVIFLDDTKKVCSYTYFLIINFSLFVKKTPRCGALI